MTHFDAATKEALDNIKKFNNSLNPYANLKAGETKDWYFDPNSIEEITSNKFNQPRIRFKIYDPDMDAEFIWDASMGAARQVIAAMSEQQFFLKVSRQGDGKETRYSVTPINAQPEAEEMKTEDSGGELE
jgi:hypothetical protein